MGKERKSSDEIIPIIAQLLTEDEQSLGRLVEQTKSTGEIKYSTLERHLKLIVLIESLFQDMKLCYQEHEIAGRVYKTAWLEPKE